MTPEKLIRACHQAGFIFTPLNGKKPRLKDWPNLPPPTVEEVIKWAEHGNIGLRTGAGSGFVVIDIDSGAEKTIEDFPKTVTIKTGSGFHLIYKTLQPVQSRNGKPFKHVDILSDGKQCVFAGSIHPDTLNPYSEYPGRGFDSIVLAEFPHDMFAEIIVTKKGPKPVGKKKKEPKKIVVSEEQLKKSRDRSGLLSRCKRYLSKLDDAVDGDGGHDQTFQAACLCVRFGLDPTETMNMMRWWNRNKCRPPWEEVDIMHKIEDAEVKAGHERGSMANASPDYAKPDDYILIPGNHDVDGELVTVQTPEFVQKVCEKIDKEAVYIRDFVPGELHREENKTTFAPLADKYRMAVIMAESVPLYKTKRNKDEELSRFVPITNYNEYGSIVHSSMCKKGVGSGRIRRLTSVTPFPVYQSDWALTEPGFNEASGIFYDHDPRVRIDPITDQAEIHDLLSNLVIDFPFDREGYRQNFFGLMLTALIRPAIRGNVPMHMCMAPRVAVGKTKLISEFLGIILTGEPLDAMVFAGQEDEREKRIIAALLESQAFMFFDNIGNFLDSPSLATLITTRVYTGRILGMSRIAHLRNSSLIVATGNQVQASSDIIRRTVPICLFPNCLDPTKRKDFVHRRPEAYLKISRNRILSALVGMVENWKRGGKKEFPDIEAMGNFEEWYSAVGSIMLANGFTQWRKNDDEWRGEADDGTRDRDLFLREWFTRWKDRKIKADDLLDMMKETGIYLDRLEKCSGNIISERIALRRIIRGHRYSNGAVMTGMVNYPYAGHRVHTGNIGGSNFYQLLPRTDVHKR